MNEVKLFPPVSPFLENGYEVDFYSLDRLVGGTIVGCSLDGITGKNEYLVKGNYTGRAYQIPEQDIFFEGEPLSKYFDVAKE